MKTGSGLCATLVAVLALSACEMPASDADPASREAADRARIESLMWNYVRALDSLDGDAYAAVYTADGSFVNGDSVTSGRAALREMIAGISAGRGEQSPPSYHVITNSSIEFTGPDSARFHSYWLTVYGPSGVWTGPRVASVGRAIDEVRRIDGEWLIQSRNIAPED